VIWGHQRSSHRGSSQLCPLEKDPKQAVAAKKPASAKTGKVAAAGKKQSRGANKTAQAGPSTINNVVPQSVQESASTSGVGNPRLDLLLLLKGSQEAILRAQDAQIAQQENVTKQLTQHGVLLDVFLSKFVEK
jgi:hypothetical protein